MIEASAEQLFYHLISSDIAGMTKDCLELIYDEVKEEPVRERMERFTRNKDWKAPRQVHKGCLFQILQFS